MAPANQDGRQDQQSETRWTAEDIEAKFENFVFLVIKEGLKKFQSHKKEGHLKGDKKSPKDTTLVEIGGAILGGAAGAPFGFIGTGASVGATVCKFTYEFGYGYFHRKKAKTIAKNIETKSIDETQILNMLAAIGAEIFRVFEDQLSNREINDLKKVVHDLVVSLYNAICDNPDILDEDEPERSVTLARSATDQKTVLDRIRGGHPLGIYDHGKYFVSENTGKLDYKFRLLFENEDINEEVWRIANDDQIGSSQPKYVVTKDMIMQVKERAISRVIAANLKMAAIQNSTNTADARDAFKEDAFEQALHAKISEVAARSEIEEHKVDQLVTYTEREESFLTHVESEVHTLIEKEQEIGKRKIEILKRAQENNTLSESTTTRLAALKEGLDRVIERQQRKPKVDPSFKADAPDFNYVQRQKPYEELKEFYDSRPKGILGSERMAVILGESGVGKSDLARNFANKQFKEKNVLWIEATDEKTLNAAFFGIAKKLEIDGLEENKDPLEIQKEIYSVLAAEATLVIFDNVNMFDDIEPFLPWTVSPDAPSPNVLITSKSDESHWEMVQYVCDCRIIKVEAFNQSECVQFVKNSLLDGGYDLIEMGDRDEDIIQLGTELRFMPEGLANAVNNILDEQCSLTDYLSSIRNNKSDNKQD